MDRSWEDDMSYYSHQLGYAPQMGFSLADITGVNIDFTKCGQAFFTGGTEGAKKCMAELAITNPELQTYAQASLEASAAQKIGDFVVKNKTLVLGGVALVGAAVLYMAFFKK